MILSRLTRTALALLASAALCGCFPAGSSQSGEEKESHFLAGRQRVNAMDFTGAIEAFEQALEVNPRSAAAHFELGWLYAEKNPDPATAIYHYEHYLKLRPNAENAETIKQVIFRLKQELAKAVLPLPSTPGVQRELEQLAEQNRQLREENIKLRDEVGQWRAYYANRGTSSANPPDGASVGGHTSPTFGGAQMASSGDSGARSLTHQSATGAVGRTHKVQAGDTPSAIARKYNVKLEALMAANPGLNPKRLQIGQSLNIPVP